MNDHEKSKSELIAELHALRLQVARLQSTDPVAGSVPLGLTPPASAVQLPTEGDTKGTDPTAHLATIAQLAATLHQHEARLEEIQHVAKLGYYSYQIIKDTVQNSVGLLDILGIDDTYQVDEHGWLTFVHPEQRAAMIEYLNEIFTKRMGFDREFQIVHHQSGEVRWVHGLGQLRLDEAGNPLELFGTIQDITERKEAEAALQQSNQTYRNLIDGMNETVWVIGPDLTFLDVNRTAIEVMQYTREELLAMGPFDIDDQLDPDAITQFAEAMARDRIQVFETIHRAKDGRRIPVEVQSTMVSYQGENAFLSIARNITERKEAEEALRKSEETYHSIINGMKEAVWVVDFDMCFIDFNQAAGEMLQYSREELLTMGPPDIDPNLTEEVLTKLEQSPARDRIRIFETEHRRKDGTFIPVEIQSTVITYRGKDVVLSISRDITERKKTAQELHRVEATNRLLAGVVRQTSESVIITDLAGQIEYVNPAYETMTGYRADEVLGQALAILHQTGGDRNDTQTPWEALQRNETWSGRYVNKRKDGQRYDEDAIFFPIHDAAGQSIKYCKIARDVSHELQLERQLSQAQRLETIGTLAGGIAHDFNNILTPIMGYAEMALSTLPSSDPLQANMQQILKGAHRARELVRQILTFSRQNEQQRQPLYLHTVIKEVLKLMRPSIPSTIDIRQYIDPTCEKVLADATQIHQVIVNLCTNAFQAMETQGGILTITLEQVQPDPALMQLYPNLKQTEYAQLTVADSGIGMDKVTMERIFEPFFTTKSVNQGTGLGLSVVHGIIRAHEGALLVSSTPGQGASFQVLLPIFIDEADDLSEHGHLIERGKETILLVDDEIAVTDVMQMMLEWLDYHVETYNNSSEALRAFQRRPTHYDLVISDLTMPGMTGVDLARRLQEARAGIPVMIITGYGNNLDAETQQRYGISHVAGKPIVINELASLIRHVLDK